jgi:hypothetical protein
MPPARSAGAAKARNQIPISEEGENRSIKNVESLRQTEMRQGTPKPGWLARLSPQILLIGTPRGRQSRARRSQKRKGAAITLLPDLREALDQKSQGGAYGQIFVG